MGYWCGGLVCGMSRCERWSSLYAVAVDEVAQCREHNTCAANRASHFFAFVKDVLSAKEI